MNKDAFTQWQEDNFNQLAEDWIQTDVNVYDKFNLWCIDQYISHVIDQAEHYKEVFRTNLE